MPYDADLFRWHAKTVSGLDRCELEQALCHLITHETEAAANRRREREILAAFRPRGRERAVDDIDEKVW